MSPQDALDIWAPRLRLGDWQITLSTDAPDEDSRSNVDLDVNIRSAFIRLREDTPDSQVERQVVHELLHVVFAGMADTYHAAKEHTPKVWDDVGDRMWHRAEEAAIEALTDALTNTRRASWAADGEAWARAFPA